MEFKQFIHKKPYLIAGPCSAESENQLLTIAKAVEGTADVFRAGIWKPRTNPNSFEGIGKDALSWLKRIQQETSLKVVTEVATAKHVELCLESEVDMLWIGARTTVNPFYVQEIAEALRGVDIPVFVKNPIHPELGLWLGTFERLHKVGVKQLAAIHRGFYSYEKGAFRNDPKWEIPIKLREEIRDLPIICDPSHIAGKAALVEDIAQTAMDISLDGLMIETHHNQAVALSDAEQQVTPIELNSIMNNLVLRDTKLRDEEFRGQLLNFRNQIDNLDTQIIELLNNRKQVVEHIANFKNENRLTIFQIDRWFEILNTRKENANLLGVDKQMVEEIFALIHKYSILTQTKIMRK
ncbi:MAG: bifunctional 3-deoxy-7-phosphoheptulonate synthase/chorismate mutase type II [Flavobacteriales bacterium]|jgi:chorismate mutase|nr:bifunctional 3-deoxy-7-phosphoheptulonate synthase/chorismate mutase type II [Flavobacteriales bacterium]MBT5090028.1 bifunctional 3-deoxy-7-phosphoheptulonate synthase/chorismate mutase type II [Flavobacteriales bacterium]MBT5751065.1 bifunctional 3-deoxy-7-phosphoheptulonate synthase/chorismate mutase type II [Flavobacteriales bacterium]